VILVHGVPSVFVEREVSEVKRGRPSVAISKVKGLIREHLEVSIDGMSGVNGITAIMDEIVCIIN